MGARIDFTVSLDTLAGRLGKQVLLRLSTATARILAREMQENLTPGLFLHARPGRSAGTARREQEPIALACRSRSLSSMTRASWPEQAGIRHALEASARLHERPPRVVQVARSDPSLLQLAPAALVSGASRREVPETEPRRQSARHRVPSGLLRAQDANAASAVPLRARSGGCIANRALMPPDNTVTASSPARAGREIALQQHLFLAAETRDSNVTGPTPMRSPSRSQVGAPTTVPFSSTPFTDAVEQHPRGAVPLDTGVGPGDAGIVQHQIVGTGAADADGFRIEPEPPPAPIARSDGESESHLRSSSKEHLVSDRPEEHQEQRGKDEQDERQEQLHRRFVGESLPPAACARSAI